LPLLQQVDVPILVQKRDHSWEDMDVPGLRRVQGVGPEGWIRAILELFGP
jgi:mannosyl-3-phosphoglycerate phosphatase